MPQLMDALTSTRTPVTLTVQKTILPTANVNQSFCDIEQPTISNIIYLEPLFYGMLQIQEACLLIFLPH